MTSESANIAYIEPSEIDAGVDRRPPPPGRQAVVLAALVLGSLGLALQLWLLTVALELFLEGDDGGIWPLAVISGLTFAGGLAVLRLLSRRARIWSG